MLQTDVNTTRRLNLKEEGMPRSVSIPPLNNIITTRGFYLIGVRRYDIHSLEDDATKGELQQFRSPRAIRIEPKAQRGVVCRQYASRRQTLTDPSRYRDCVKSLVDGIGMGWERRPSNRWGGMGWDGIGSRDVLIRCNGVGGRTLMGSDGMPL